MDTAVVMTDAGRAHLKVMGNKQGPHTLACELICTRLARWFGVPTPDAAILVLTEADTFDLNDGRQATPGPAFASRTIEAVPWDGTEDTLALLDNVDRLARLVVFDTWIRNDDRHPPVNTAGELQSNWPPNRENLLIRREDQRPPRRSFTAIDFGRGLTGGKDLSSDVREIEAIQDPSMYGLFPQFQRFLTISRVDEAVEGLRQASASALRDIIGSVPREWEVRDDLIEAIAEMLCRRAGFLADNMRDLLPSLPDENLRDRGSGG